MRDYRNLKIWQRSHLFTLEIYRVTGKFPKDELYSLTSQVRRAAYSIPTNIAEGCGREGDAEFHRYLVIASGSASELDYQLLLSRDLNYLEPEVYETLFQELSAIRRMLNTLLQKLKANR